MRKKSKNLNKVIPIKKSQCPICDKPSSDLSKPFCSNHCANIDLGRWLDGKYRILTNEVPIDGGSIVIEDD
tara:strand:+ start:505 stop:717 length:213 start_codon:yes stop_codon:yes gene_type:complete